MELENWSSNKKEIGPDLLEYWRSTQMVLFRRIPMMLGGDCYQGRTWRSYCCWCRQLATSHWCSTFWSFCIASCHQHWQVQMGRALFVQRCQISGQHLSAIKSRRRGVVDSRGAKRNDRDKTHGLFFLRLSLFFNSLLVVSYILDLFSWLFPASCWS